MNQPVRPGEWVMAIAATISATPALQFCLKVHGLRRLHRERTLVALQRGAGVGGVRGPEEEAQDLRHVILMHAEIHHPLGVLIADGFVFLGRQPGLTGQARQITEPAGPERRVLADGVHHHIGRQGLVAALDVAHPDLRTLGLTSRNMTTQRSAPRLRTSWETLAGNFTIVPAGTTTSSPAMLMFAVPSSTKIASSSRGWLCITVDRRSTR